MAYRALFEWQSPLVFISVMLATPFFQIIFFTSFGPAFSHLRPSFFAAGNALQVSAMAGVYGVSQTIANERLFGAINNIFVSPANRLALYLGRSLPHAVIGALTSAAGLAMAVLLTDLTLTPSRWAALALLLAVTTASCTAIGLILGALGLIGRDTTITANVAYLGILLLSGAAVPASRLPAIIAAAARGIPMTNGVRAFRWLLSHGPDARFYELVLWEALVGTCWVVATILLLQWIEKRARRMGTLDIV